MHPKNIYKNAPNFKDLAINYPEFRKFVKVDISGKVKFDFQNKDALNQLTKTLLLRDFNLTLDIPPDKLIPTLPLRLNYILWVEDLLNALNLHGNISGVDIGTGATCIYALLAARKGWKMLATELNPSSAEAAKENVEKNSLSELIKIKQVSNPNQILVDVIDNDQTYHFSMCNPPFFNKSQIPENRTDRRQPPSNAPSGTIEELETEGGEIAFISKMIEDSVVLKERIVIFTTLVGRRSSLKVLKPKVRGCQVKSMISGEFVQGKTTRWGLAWSYSVDLPKIFSSEKQKQSDRNKIPLAFSLPEGNSLGFAVERVKTLLQDLKMKSTEINDKPFTCKVTATENTWSNQRRRRRQKKRDEEGLTPTKKAKLEETKDVPESSKEIILEYLIRVEIDDKIVILELSWLSGTLKKDALNQVVQFMKNNWIVQKDCSS